MVFKMNERIRQLAEQAQGTKKYVPPVWQFYDAELEKFANLIIQESVQVCAGIAAVRAGYNDADGRDTAYSCGDMIKEHFGVE